MDAQKQARIIEALVAIIEESGVSREALFDRMMGDEPQSRPVPEIDPVEALREALKKAKKVTGLDHDALGRLLGVSGGAVGHWMRARTNPSEENQARLFHWLRDVENALGVELLPAGFEIADEATSQGAIFDSSSSVK